MPLQTFRITTRTIPPTDTKGKRVHVRSDNGAIAEYPWDHSKDAPEVHEAAAIKLARLGNPDAKITAHRIDTTALGYRFRVFVGEADQ